MDLEIYVLQMVSCLVKLLVLEVVLWRALPGEDLPFYYFLQLLEPLLYHSYIDGWRGRDVVLGVALENGPPILDCI